MKKIDFESSAMTPSTVAYSFATAAIDDCSMKM